MSTSPPIITPPALPLSVTQGGTGQSSAGAQLPWLPLDNALLAANDVLGATSTTQVLIAGTLYLTKIPVRVAVTATNVCVVVSGAGVGASSGSFAGLYSSAGTLLSGSADVGSTLTGSGPLALPLTTPQSLTAGTFVWAALLVNLATTQPTLRVTTGDAPGNANAFLTPATYRAAANGTLLSSLPGSVTPASNATGFPFWIGLS